MPRNSARNRSSSSSGARSCRVTTIDTAVRVGRADRGGVDQQREASAVGAESTTCSARTVSAPLITRFIGNSASATSRPSEKRHMSASSSCSGRRVGRAQPAGKPPGLRCSSRCVRALATALANWEANNTRRSSSSAVNARPPSFLGEEEVPDVQAPVAHRRRPQAGLQHQVRGQAERADVGLQVRHSERSREVAQVLEEAHRVRPPDHLPLLVDGESEGDELLRLPGLVDGGDHAVAGAGQGAGAVDVVAAR